MRKGLLLLLFLVMTVAAMGVMPAVSLATAEKPAQAEEQSAVVNINTAGVAELEALPGIGPKIAEEIVKHREANGPFKSVDDIKGVKGVGDKKFEAIKDKIAL